MNRLQVETMVLGAFEANCFILHKHQGKAIVIDPGAQPELIIPFLEKAGLTPEIYLLTHGHMDHVSALADLHTAFPAPVAMHPDDRKWAFEAMNQMPPFYPPPLFPACGVDRSVQDAQTWSDAGITFTVVGTPGHTPGSVCFYFPVDNLLFSGDTLFAGSVGRTDLPGGNSRTLGLSLARLAKLPPKTLIFPGHGEATELDYELKHNFFMQKFPPGGST